MLHHGQWRRWAWPEAFDGIIVHGLGSPTLLTRVAPKTILISRLFYESTVWVLNTSLISSNFEKFSVPQGTEVWLSPLSVAELLTKKVDLFGGAPHKGFRLDLFFRPGNSSPYAKKACCQRWSITGHEKGKIGESFGYPFAQSFPCAGASFHRNTCFFPFDQNGRFSTGCITIGDVQQVDSGIGWSSLTTLKSSACSAEVAAKTTEFWTCMAD